MSQVQINGLLITINIKIIVFASIIYNIDKHLSLSLLSLKLQVYQHFQCINYHRSILLNRKFVSPHLTLRRQTGRPFVEIVWGKIPCSNYTI